MYTVVTYYDSLDMYLGSFEFTSYDDAHAFADEQSDGVTASVRDETDTELYVTHTAGS